MSFLSHININPFKNSRVRKILGLPEITETHGILCRRTILGEDKYYLAKDTFSKDSTPIELTKKVKNPHPTNATNELERVMYNHDDIVELYKTNPHLDRTVGSLPQHWGKLVGNSPEKRKAIDAAFTEFGQKYFSLEEKNFEQNISILQNKLSKILEKEIKITPVNNGCWGMVYKISDDGPVDYALKVFHYKDAVIESGTEHIRTEILLAVSALVICLVQFAVGHWLGRRYGDESAGGQALGQKNTVLAIWLAQSFLNPLACIAPTAYIVWQNLVNSFQIYKHR